MRSLIDFIILITLSLMSVICATINPLLSLIIFSTMLGYGATYLAG